MEQLVDIITAYSPGTSGSLAVVIPKKARELLEIKKGDSLLVKIDDQGRLIYEKNAPLKKPITQS